MYGVRRLCILKILHGKGTDTSRIVNGCIYYGDLIEIDNLYH